MFEENENGATIKSSARVIIEMGGHNRMTILEHDNGITLYIKRLRTPEDENIGSLKKKSIKTKKEYLNWVTTDADIILDFANEEKLLGFTELIKEMWEERKRNRKE